MYDNIPIRSNNIVFLGDSLTEGFDLRKYFKRNDLVNRGISGNTSDHVLYRLEEIVRAKPKKVLLMIGVNDLLQGASANDISMNIIQIADNLLAGSPATVLCFQSLLPVNEDKLLIDTEINTMIYDLNNRIRKTWLSRDMPYIDLYGDFLNETGQLDASFTFDGVHLNEKAYSLWASLVKDILD